ncbi:MULTISPECIES: ABC transporter ATP-binding protein [Aerococcus]|uniref:ABC-type quaternary amine transporter n=1 Tax=Aerococcus sanguinicola TaxID=119206 RepID=A0A5N1GIY4_9LACT|nr:MULTISPECIES: ABC transporter ATP-binding protein [Aerococcus]KAA9300149.1 ABC transporter ATP-binding protein [Aerococcus sanguinicola]MDK6369491.1 ABC transporter ATP-binding protein [Aerococcus sp. UMB9870]MDK6679978.1 ABC transporter ATP-binding protein [Aerococcus sp. UMB8608]MDK6686140.1 ABC transporter ATP-binding protein [Aerococcus sp. UMB8623]MDK6939920.1 ABC transporter ATP-binding protein [Aerococcus sp. UMB8487]
MIEFKNIEIKFGDFTAIENLSLHINRGEFFTFLGPSGCGKTTTLRSLVGFIKPTKGQIYLDNKEITNVPIEKRKIGMVFQSYALFPTMTVRENIEFGMKENKWDKSRIKDKVQEVAQMVNLTPEQLQKNVSELSGGQQQRVAIARALSLEPDVICLDEPLSNLDAKLRGSLRQELKKIQRQSGATMIYVTHDQEEALALSDRIAVFSNGKIQQVGTPLEIYNNPKNSFVATFIGDRYRVDERFIEAVKAHNPHVKVNPAKDYYIKTEGVQLKKEIENNSNDIYTVPGTLINQEFLGNTIRREYDVNGTIVPSIVFSQNAVPITNPKVELAFHHDSLFSFAKED